MNRVRITAIRQTVYPDLTEKYENPIEHACDVVEGQQWISEKGEQPEGMCPAAWYSMRELVESLAKGEGNFYDEWMKNRRTKQEQSQACLSYALQGGGRPKVNPMSAMISCNDGFRPFSFYIETINE